MKISHSKAQTYLSCPRKYRYSYVDKRVPLDDKKSAAFGVAGHLVLAQHYRGEKVTVPLGPGLSKFDRECLRLLYAGYVAMYGAPVGIREVEVLHELPVAGNVLVVKFDALIGPDDDVTIMDHKFTGSSLAAGGFFWERFSLDAQVSLYWLAVLSMGFTPGRFVVDAIRRPITRAKDPMSALPGIEEKIATEPESFYARADYYRTESELAAAEEDLGAVRNLLLGNPNYPRNTGNCFQYGDRCQYWEVCSGVSRLDDNNMFKDKEIDESVSTNDLG